MGKKSQPNTQEDTTPERLEHAKGAYDHTLLHVSELESKARTFLTVNSLLVVAGVLSALRILPATKALPLQVATLLFTLVLLGFVAAAFLYLFRVLDVHTFQGRPRGTSTLKTFCDDDGATMRESLAQYYAEAADLHIPATREMTRDLRIAIQYTKSAFIFFVATVLMLLFTGTLHGFQ